MQKQLFLAGGGALLVLALFFFGKTTTGPKKINFPQAKADSIKSFDIQQFISSAKAGLSPAKAVALSKLENGITRGDIPAQEISANEALAAFWRDSANAYEPYAYYIAKAAELDNSEKKLTFAARLFSDNLRGEADEAKLRWETTTAIDLYNRAIILDPGNDDLHIGLGSCYIFGSGKSGDPQETMKGVGELLEVVRKDSTNMKAQMVLGVGGIVSGQYDKAIERLNKVVAAQPSNAEAVSFLADAYAAKGDKANAVKWYSLSKRLLNNADYSREADARINGMK